MTEHTFECQREMNGDKEYKEGDTRTLLALDAIHLVRSGALIPKGAEAVKAMAALMSSTPEEKDGIVQQLKNDAPRNKDAGGAPRNKDAGGAPGNKGAKTAAKPAKPAKAAGGPATGTGTGNDDQGGGSGGGEGEGSGSGSEASGSDGGGTTPPAGGAALTTGGPATGAPVKRR